MSETVSENTTSEITRHETAERARLLHVDSYDVTLDFTRGDDVFRSVSVIRFTAPSRARTATRT